MTEREPVVPQQRRQAVRARVRVPVTVTVDGERLRGNTLDLSEGGASCAVTAGATTALPAVGSDFEVELVLDARRVWLRGILLTAVHRRGWWILTVAFAQPPERDQELLRRHVFTVLRRDRAAGFS